MLVATWISAIATAAYLAAIIFSLIFIYKQVREAARLSEVTLLKEVYDYIVDSHKARGIIYDTVNYSRIKRINTVKQLQSFELNYPDTAEAIHKVANCYHYIGFLMKNRLLKNKKAFFDEGGHTFYQIYERIIPIIELDRQKTGKMKYKQYLGYLYEEYKKYKANN